MGETRRLTILMPAPPGWPAEKAWQPQTTVLAHLADDSTLYVAPLGSPPFPGPAVRVRATGQVEYPLWVDAGSDPQLADAARAWDAAR